MMGDPRPPADLALRGAFARRGIGRTLLGLLRTQLQERRADLHRVGGQRAYLEAVAVGQDHHRDQTAAAAGDAVQVEAQQRLALDHPRTFLDQRLEAFALQLYGVEADVQQQLGTVVGAQAERVAGSRQVADQPGAGRVQAVVERVDGDAFAQGAAGKHRVGYSVERHHGAAQGRFEGEVLVVHGRALRLSGFG